MEISGWIILEKDLDSKFIQVLIVKEIRMKDSGIKVTEMERVHIVGKQAVIGMESLVLIILDILENGNLERNTDMEYFILQSQEIDMKDIMQVINEMEKEPSIGQMYELPSRCSYV